MRDIVRVAIDGPSGAGKSTIAKEVAKKMNLNYIDTGAMYRAFGYKLFKENISVNDKESLLKSLYNTDIDFRDGNIYLDNESINNLIRTPEISRQASICSAIKEVREHLVELQQRMGETKSVIMDGRDIGTVVFPDAEFKYYITASAEERANRRFKELKEKGLDVEYRQVLDDINERDHQDTTRINSPLRKAIDAREIDTTNMSIDDVVNYICEEMNKLWQ